MVEKQGPAEKKQKHSRILVDFEVNYQNGMIKPIQFRDFTYKT